MESRDEIFDDANGDLATGELESAVEKYRRCVEIDPEYFDGWHALGMTLMKIGRFPEAIEAGKRATELRPERSDRLDQLVAYSTIAMATSRKPKLPEQKRRFSRGAGKLPEHRPLACAARKDLACGSRSKVISE